MKMEAYIYESVRTPRGIGKGTGVIRESKDADVGPIHTGGVMSYIEYVGAQEFAGYSEKLSLKFGDRFALPESLKDRIEKAGSGRVFYNN
jgi:3-hydroxyacyl-CoA dehydrogenase/enoyl-CoA hydratase/3-hydroxybutyryl-CoA epimerase